MKPLEVKTIQFNGKYVGIIGNGQSKKFHKIHPEIQRLNEEHGTGLKLIDAVFAHKMLKTKWPQMIRAFPFATDAVMAHEAPGTSFGSEITFAHHGNTTYVFPTGQYKGEKDLALVVLGLSSSDMKRDNGNVIFDVDKNRVIPVPDFPSASGYYKRHDKTTLPHGEIMETPHREYARLYRTTGSYVGSIVRDADAWTLKTSFGPWDEFAMVVTGSKEDFRKLGVTEEPDVMTRLSSRPPPKSEAPSLGRRIIDSIFPKE